MNIDITRVQRQMECLEAWKQNYGRGTVEACTRFGKTYMAIIAIKQICQAKGHCKVLVDVPLEVNKTHWENEFFEHNIVNCAVYVYNSLQGMEYKCDLFIADEIHSMGSEENIKIFENVKYKWVLGLTGTFERPDGRHTLVAKYAPVVERVTRQEALKNNWISFFEIHTFSVKMKDRAEYDRISQKMRLIEMTTGNFIRCQYITKNKSIFAPSVVKLAFEMMSLVRQRKELVYGQETKLEKARDLLKMYPDQAIVFFERIDDAKRFGEMIEPFCKYAIYTGSEKTGEVHKSGKQAGKPKRKITPKKTKEAILTSFRSGETRVLLAVNALNMGVELNVSLAIITAGNSSWVDFEQRLGRVLTLKEGQICRLFQIICSGTIESSWTNSRSKNVKTIKHELQ